MTLADVDRELADLVTFRDGPASPSQLGPIAEQAGDR